MKTVLPYPVCPQVITECGLLGNLLGRLVQSRDESACFDVELSILYHIQIKV